MGARVKLTVIFLVCLQAAIVTSLPVGIDIQHSSLMIPSKRQSTLWASFLNTVVSHNIDDIDEIDKDLADHLKFTKMKNEERNSAKKWKSIDCLVHVVSCYRRRRKRLSLATGRR